MNQVTRLALIDRADADLSIMAQCRLLKVARSSLYRRPAAASEDDLRLMRRIERLHQALGYQTPREVFQATVSCGDVGNASALPTSPQVHHQQQERDSIELEEAYNFVVSAHG